MTKRELLSLAFKSTGIANAIYCIYNFLTTIRTWHQMTGFLDPGLNFSAFWATQITSTLAQILFSLPLVLWGDGLARWLAPADAALLPLNNPLREKALLDSVVKFLGVLWLCKGLPDLLATAARLGFHWVFLKNDQATMTDLNHPVETILVGIALLVLGHYLGEYAYRKPREKVTVT
jgi:hypothetical protein